MYILIILLFFEFVNNLWLFGYTNFGDFMNKKFWIIPIILLVVGIAGFVYFNNSNKNNSSNENNYQANRTSTTNNQNSNEQKNNSSKNQTNNEQKSNSTENKTNNQVNSNTQQNTEVKKEEQISTFSTKIYDTDPARQNNIRITCSRLNGLIVQNGETFSFTGTLGPSNQNNGYQKADIFDNKGRKQKQYGGGNCQISSTLYNAVLAVPTLVVTERHAHSNYVPYIQRGKDAAVAYGSYDLKFRNDTGNAVKILTATDGANVTATLVSIK